MLPLTLEEGHMLFGACPDTRPPPIEFAELFGAIVHVMHTMQDKLGRIDSRKAQAMVALANAAVTAQVFDFGDIPEKRLIEEAKTGGDLMGQKLLRLPYPSVLYWYTLTNLVNPVLTLSKEVLPRQEASRIRYATLAAEAPDGFWAADFMLLDPETAQLARNGLTHFGGTMAGALERGRHIFLCCGISQLTPTTDGRWAGYLLDRPGEGVGTEEMAKRDHASLGSVADGVAAMTMILATKGVGVRHEPAPVRLNAKREAQGKPPYPSITHVDARMYFDAMQRTALGGTHASPVPHLRRGHVREYSDGRKTWVRSCLVNCRSLVEAQTRELYEVKV